jgi:hypothetical protein
VFEDSCWGECFDVSGERGREANGWRRLHNEDLCHVYPKYRYEIKENEVGVAQRAWQWWEIHTLFWLENLKGKDHLEDLGLDEEIILEYILGI